MPGQYTVVLTVNGQRYAQPLTIEMDPRVKTPIADLQKQFDLSYEVYQDLLTLQPVIENVAAARAQLKATREKATSGDAAKIDKTSKELESLAGGEDLRQREPQAETLTGVRASLLLMLTMLQEVDAGPTMQATAAVPKLHQSVASLIEQWQEMKTKQLVPLTVGP